MAGVGDMRYSSVILLFLISPVFSFRNPNNKLKAYYINRTSVNCSKQEECRRSQFGVYSLPSNPNSLFPLRFEPENVAKAVVAIGAGTYFIYSLLANYWQRKDEKRRIERELRHLDKARKQYIETGIDPDLDKRD